MSVRVQELQHLAAAMAHEVRNPLNSMAIHVELLEGRLKREGAKPEIMKSLSVLSDEIDRVDKILEQYLTYAGPLEATVRYENSGISLTAPTAQAATSWTDAYANCLSGAAICDATSPPTISLANATVDKAGTAGPNGSLVPLLSNTLVYVLSWTGVPCAPAGGPPGSKSTTQKFSCTLLNLVDAKSGKVLYTVESPTP